MLLDDLARHLIYVALVTLQRRKRSERVHDRRAGERHAHRSGLQEAHRERRARLHEDGEQREEEKRCGAARHTASRHVALADLGHHAPHVPSLQHRTDNADGPNELPVLRVGPVEYCM